MYNILVSGVGGVIGYGVLRALKDSRHPTKLIGLDTYEDAVGARWCDFFHTATPVKSSGYKDFIRGICEKYDIDLFIPVVVQEIERLGQEPDLLQGLKTKIALNNPALIKVSYDKWTMNIGLIENQLPAIPSSIDDDFDDASKRLGLPMLMKPRRSYGSKGIFEVHDRNDFEYWRNKMGDNFMVQRLVGSLDTEYTASLFGYGDRKASVPIILRRRLGPDGSTSKAWVVPAGEPSYDLINSVMEKLVAIYAPVGPTNFQFRLEGETAYLLEINPRISSATSIRAAFGYNEPEMCITYYVESVHPQPERILRGHVARYLQDVTSYVSNNL